MNNVQAEARPRESGDGPARLPLAGLLLIQLFLGYEWLMSGLAKIVRGDFTTHLHEELATKSRGAAGWYRSFVDSAVIPNGTVFGYLIEIGEVLIGIALIAAALVWLLRWERLPNGGRAAVLLATALAALGGIFMNVNFHLANGSAHPWFIPRDAFDEGVDLDSLMPALQLVLIGVSIGLLRSLRRRASRPAAIGEPKPHGA